MSEAMTIEKTSAPFEWVPVTMSRLLSKTWCKLVLGIGMPIFFAWIVRDSAYNALIAEIRQFLFCLLMLTSASMAWAFFASGNQLRFQGFLGGVQILGGIQFFLIGLVLLPLSIMLVPFLIGLLGVLPFLSAWTFFKSGWNAKERVSLASGEHAAIKAAFLGIFSAILFAACFQSITNYKVRSLIAELEACHPEEVDNLVGSLPALSPLMDFNPMLIRYMDLDDKSIAKKNLKMAYEKLTREKTYQAIGKALD